jgi:hypothetical protein
MDLPVRILGTRPEQQVISVDGAWDAPGLNLSHWPGNRTPPELAHELSTGVALNFARLPQARREELARGCVAIANNHFDTDGVCALFAVRYPQLALQHERALLDAAAAGDFFEFPSEAALALDLFVAASCDAQRSPIAAELVGLDSHARYQRATEHLLANLPELLNGGLAAQRALWSAEVEATKAERRELERCTRDDVAHLDWTTWVAPRSAQTFSPGRHALLGSSRSDRVLIAAPAPGGMHYRLVVSTRSWFELPGRERAPRPDLRELAARLNALEGCAASDALAWRAQAADTPSPEVWFGGLDHDLFAERCAALAPSSLDVATVRKCVAQVLRESLALPE